MKLGYWTLLLATTLTVCLATLDIMAAHEPQSVRLVGGTDAKNSTFVRHVAQLLIIDREGAPFACTATVVGHKWLLSAAHCFKKSWKKSIDTSKSFALIGEIQTNPFIISVRRFAVKAVYVHRDFKRELFLNDVALVELSVNITAKYYYPIRLGFTPPAPRTVVVAGYGTKDRTGMFPQLLQQANLRLQKFSTCTDFNGAPASKENTAVCATAKGFPDKAGPGICAGDSGGPLMFSSEQGFVQFAITSQYTIGECARPDTAMYFMKVEWFYDLLKRKVENNDNRLWERLS